MTRLAGKRAVILGAASRDNMAQRIATRFAAEGATVLVAGRHADELARFAAEIGGHAHLCDITRRDDCVALAQAATGRLGGIDIALNATGWGLLKPFELTTEDELRRMTDLQFIGPFLFFQAMLGAMADGGSLIQISSATATIMLEDHAAYMGTKAGFDHVMRCLANEYGVRGIRANSISPGLTDTPMAARAKAVPGIFETYRSCYPLGRFGTPEDIAAAAVWLASDECFMTGQNLQVNGGLTLRRNPTNAEFDAASISATGKPRPRSWLKTA
ncbi:SDR family oxidoreductase [Aromatoleum toluvorans]|uniref:SDR family oxidoreductase n=1 Tax=Aromatoleum toluvorans TaxID=92002 RepID=A0ABX1PSS1_9RHOO|nr:SDR family oxidoreductase [Aromatoleum toluvorans]NMG42498.1 SDR family oxidoreductase [Aromatoleum toluvorans]